ncbi:MAG: lasso peptide biosynthesis B2 protein [Brevundimonas sp.]
MATRLWSAPDVHLAQLEEDIVILDTVSDRYSCLLEAADHVQLEPSGALIAADADIARDLLQAGVAVEAPFGEARRPITLPGHDLQPAGSPSRMDVFRAGLVLATATLAFRRQTLAQLVEDRPGPPPAGSEPGLDRLASLLAAERAARPWIPGEGQCLQRTYLLRRLLHRSGLRPDWIFGVRTWPFAAHCWLQIGDLVVGDRLERVRRFTPIMGG